MNITMVGIGDMWSKNNSACFLINDKILIDIPNGTCKQLRRMGKKVRHIEVLIITHLHGDHFFDIPFFLAAKLRTDNHRLKIIANKEARRKIEALIKLGFPDWIERVVSKLDIEWIDNKNMEDYVLPDNIKLTSLEVEHGGFKPSHGYQFSNNGLKLGFSGDATLCKNVEYLCETSKYMITDVSEPESTEAHMGLEAFNYLVNRYPDTKFIPNHMDNIVFDSLVDSEIENMILLRDGEEIYLE